VTLFVSEPLDPATVSGALHLAENGVIVSGDIRLLGNGQVSSSSRKGHGCTTPW